MEIPRYQTVIIKGTIKTIKPLTLLVIIFIVLRVAEVTAMPWYWIIAPYWIPAGVILAPFLGGVIVYVVYMLIKAFILWLSRQRKKGKAIKCSK